MQANEQTEGSKKKDPSKEREIMDLGRFGSGLKTASISQAKKITVFSKRLDGKLSAARWDVDYVCEKKAWLLEVFSIKTQTVFPTYFSVL